MQAVRRYSVISTTSNLQRPAFPIKDIVLNPEQYAESLRIRGMKLHNGRSINDIVAQYHLQRDLHRQRQLAATEQNRIGKEIKMSLGQKGLKDSIPTNELRQLSAKAKEDRMKAEQELAAVETELDLMLDTVPNLVAPEACSVPEGHDYEVVERFGGPEPTSTSRDLSRDHVSVGLEKNIIDIEGASRVSGTGNVYLVGEGARLEQALIAYSLEICAKNGFTIVSPPTLVRPEFLAACGFRPRGDDEDTHIYETQEPKLCLSGTAEIPLLCQMAEQSLDLTHPKMNCAVSRCFRREAGSRGSDTRGLYRLHEFTKVEMVLWTSAKDSMSMLHKLVALQKEIFKSVLGGIGTPIRVINVAPHDLGAPAYQKYDIEAWMPGRGTWGEISSASNCLDFQSRRLHTKDANGEFAHTLNGTALAVPRVILAIIENGWNPKTRTISVPKVLQKYMGTDCI